LKKRFDSINEIGKKKEFKVIKYYQIVDRRLAHLLK